MALKFLPIAVAALISVSPSTAAASSRTPAEATAHALDELANVCAQRRPECPTATPLVRSLPEMSTSTPSPTSTSTPQPTDTPTPEPTATATPEPCWLTDQDLGDPDDNYIVFAADGAPIPCPTDIPTEDATEQPTATPTPLPTATPRPIPPAAPAAAVSAPAPLPTYTPYPTYTPQPTYTPVPTATPRASTPDVAGLVITALPTSTATSTPSATPTSAIVAGDVTPQPTAAPVRTAFSQLRMPSFERPWLYLSLLALFALGALAAFWLLRRGRRSYAP
jgi:hypothetical protein